MIKESKPLSLFSKVANIASFLCLIHCLASSLFAVLAPQLLKFFPHNFWLEASIWGLACASALWMLKRATCSRPAYLALLLLFLLGSFFVITHQHNFFVLCLVGLALLQMTLTLQHHWKDHKNGNCHNHSHHHADLCEQKNLLKKEIQNL